MADSLAVSHRIAAESGVAVTPAKLTSVCIVTETSSFGGTEAHTLGLIEALITSGYLIEFIANRYSGYDEIIKARGWERTVTLLDTHLGGISDNHCEGAEWKKVFSYLRSEILVFPKGHNSLGSLHFLHLCRRKFKKVVFIEHLEAAPQSAVSLRKLVNLILGVRGGSGYRTRLLSRLGSIFADSIIAVSASVKHRLVQDYGYPPGKITVIHNGIQWQDFRRSQEIGVAFRAKHRIPRNAFVFGMITRLVDQKGIDVAVRAMRKLTELPLRQPVRLVIAGEGPLRDELISLAGELHLQSYVDFVGFVKHPIEALSAYDAIVFSSRNEGLPLGLLEGMAAGCIPIVTRISGMPEAVNSPEIGCVVVPENTEELSAAMARILALDARSITAMRANAVRRIQEQFDAAHCYKRILTLCGLSPDEP